MKIPQYSIPSSIVGPMELKYVLENVDWAMQMKHNGVRGSLSIQGEKSLLYTKSSLIGTFETNKNFGNQSVWSAALIDGEILVDSSNTPMCFVCFDLIPVGERSDLDFELRYVKLSAALDGQNLETVIENLPLILTPTIVDTHEKIRAFESFKNNEVEGVVFRDRYSRYSTGKTTSILKHRFKHEGYGIVKSKSYANDSVDLCLFNNVYAGSARLSNNILMNSIDIGTIVEIDYDYYSPNGFVGAKVTKDLGKEVLDMVKTQTLQEKSIF